MRKESRKWWMINSTVVVMVIILISFVLYIWYIGYWKTKPIDLGTIVTNPNLSTIKTNGLDIPNEGHIKEKLKEQYPTLDINKITIKNNIGSSSAIVISNNDWFYLGSIAISYTIDKATAADKNLK